MNPRKVMKFGGAALADGLSVLRAAEIVSQEHEAPVLVVSAHHGVTDQLVEVAEAAARGTVDASAIRIRHRGILGQLGLDPELCDRHLSELGELLERVRRMGVLGASELDYALSFGERMSARIVARALRERGLPATPVDAFDLGLVTDSNFGGARPLEGSLATVAAALAGVPGIPVVTGFLAKDRSGNLTTLGRNGSDLSAALLAEAIGARELVLWKSVPGILTADPALVPSARPLARLSYEEAAELAFHGARVLHAAAVAPAVRARIPVRLGDVHAPQAEGTLLVERRSGTGPLCVATRRALVRLVLELEDPEARAADHSRLFRAIEQAGARPSLIGAEGQQVGALLEPGPAAERALATLGPRARLERELGLVALIGSEVGGDRSLCERALESLRAEGIQPRCAWTGARLLSQAFLLSAGELVRATHALHEALLDGRLSPA